MTVLLGTLWSSIKQIENPYVFDWENAIALDTMQGNRASYHNEGKVSCVFSSCGRNLGYILELRRVRPFETGVCSVKSRHLPRYEGQLRNVNYARQNNMDASYKLSGSSGLFVFDTVILGFPTILKNCQASSAFEAVNSSWLSSCQSDVRPLFEMRWRPRTFCRVSTGVSDILSYCDMNDEHA